MIDNYITGWYSGIAIRIIIFGEGDDIVYIDPKARVLLENRKKIPIYVLLIQKARAAMKAFQTTDRVLAEMKEPYS